MASTWRRQTVGSSLLASLLGFALAGCGSEPATLTVGDCLVSPTEGSGRAHVVACAEPHRGQVVGMYEPVGGPYPGADVLTEESEAPCEQAFTTFVGSDPLTSVLDLFPLLPTEEAWESGDRTVVCVAAVYDELMVKSSFENSHR